MPTDFILFIFLTFQRILLVMDTLFRLFFFIGAMETERIL